MLAKGMRVGRATISFLVCCLMIFAAVQAIEGQEINAAASNEVNALQAQIAHLRGVLADLIAARTSNGSALNITRTLSYGMSGDDVAALQTFLKGAGHFLCPTITGFFGSVTWQAVATLQFEQGLEAVGYVGPQTRNLISRLTSSEPQNDTPVASTSPWVKAEPPAVTLFSRSRRSAYQRAIWLQPRRLE